MRDYLSINIVCASDNNYVEPMTAMLCSCLENISIISKVKIFILDGGITKNNIQKVKNFFKKYNNVELKIISINKDLYKKYKIKNHLTDATYYRIDVPNLLPDIDRILYLDCDLIVVGDVSTIFNIDMNGKTIAACQDHDVNVHNMYNKVFKKKSKLGYFNAGVILMDLISMRNKDISSKIKVLIEKRDDIEKLPGCDQKYLNYYFFDNWVKINPQWNSQVSLESTNSYKETVFSKEKFYIVKNFPKILHFSSSICKPWLYEGVTMYKAIYEFYLDKTNFKDSRSDFSYTKLYKKFINYLYFKIAPSSINTIIYKMIGKFKKYE